LKIKKAGGETNLKTHRPQLTKSPNTVIDRQNRKPFKIQTGGGQVVIGLPAVLDWNHDPAGEAEGGLFDLPGRFAERCIGSPPGSAGVLPAAARRPAGGTSASGHQQIW